MRLLLESDRIELEQEFAFRNGSDFFAANSWGGSADIRHGIIEELENAEDFTTLTERIQHLLWSFEDRGYFKNATRYADRDYAGMLFVGELKEAIELSPGIDLRVQIQSERAELVPAGVELLDEVVDRSTLWLRNFPDVQKEFSQALRLLAENRVEQFRQAQDSLRFGLEKLLKIVLKNGNRLEDQGKPLKEWLEARGVHAALRDVAVQVMSLLTKQYQNTAVKHDNAVAGGATKKWAAFEVEYVIYQFATLIRLLLEADGGAGPKKKSRTA